MNLEEARKVIWNDKEPLVRWMEATWVITEAESDKSELLNDILQCLKRGGPCASLAALALYNRTGRPMPSNIFEFIHDPEDWKIYLDSNGYMKQQP